MILLLLLAYALCIIAFFIFAIIVLIQGDTYYAMELIRNAVLCSIPIVGFILIFKYLDKRDKQKRNKLKENMEKEGIKEFKCYVRLKDYAIGLANEGLYIVKLATMDLELIPISSILDFKIDLHTVQKNTKRIVALTSTYDTSVTISKVTCSIISNETNFVYDSWDINSSPEDTNTRRYINELERLKSLIDIEIKKSVPEKNNIEKIRELKELLDINAITQEEFNSKKTEILNKL